MQSKGITPKSYFYSFLLISTHFNGKFCIATQNCPLKNVPQMKFENLRHSNCHNFLSKRATDLIYLFLFRNGLYFNTMLLGNSYLDIHFCQMSSPQPTVLIFLMYECLQTWSCYISLERKCNAGSDRH